MKISKSAAICFLLLMPVFQPIYLDYITSSIHFYSLLQYAALAYAAAMMICQKKNLSFLTIAAICMEASIFLSTVSDHGYVGEATKQLFKIIYVFLLFDVYRNKSFVMLKSLMLHSELCVYLNFVTLLIAPEGFFSRSNSAYGMTQEWFLGADNYFVMWLFPALLVGWVYCRVTQEKGRTLLLSAVIAATELLQGSATGLVSIFLFMVVVLFPFIRKLVTPMKGAFFACAVFLCIVIFRDLEWFRPIVESIGKDMTFSGRLTIWDNAISSILARPLLGYGVLTNDQMVSYLGRTPFGIWAGATHCHSQFLQIAFQGGFIAFGFFACILGSDIKKCTKIVHNPIAPILGAGISIYMIMSVTEVFTFPVMYMIFPLVSMICNAFMRGELKHETI